MKIEDITWLAGFYEGEGTIYCGTSKHVTKTGLKKTYVKLKMCITQNDMEPLLKCQKILSYLDINGPYKNKTSKNSHYQLNAQNEYAVKFISTIYPYLSNRRKIQADKAIVKYKTHNKDELND